MLFVPREQAKKALKTLREEGNERRRIDAVK